jgi:hypothetical protein
LLIPKILVFETAKQQAVSVKIHGFFSLSHARGRGRNLDTSRKQTYLIEANKPHNLFHALRGQTKKPRVLTLDGFGFAV